MATTNRDSRFFTLIWASRLAILILMVAVSLLLDAAGTSNHRTDVRQQWQNELDEVSLNLQSTIIQNIQTVWGLAANVAVEPDIDDERFRDLASVIFQLAPQLRNIGLAPDFVIRHIYPLEGNEAALGLDLSKGSLPPAQIEQLFETRQAIYSGPINLIQGGQGLAGRIPIFARDSGEFWGVISVILDLERMYQAAGILPMKDSMRFVLSRSDNPKNQADIFLGDAKTDWQDPVAATMNMPGTRWTLFAEPAQGWPDHPASPLLTRGLLLAMVLLVTGVTFWLTSLMLKDREMQRRFWGLFEQAPIGIALYSRHRGDLLRSNRAFDQSFGDLASSLQYFERGFDQHGQPIPGGLGIQRRLENDVSFSGVESYLPGPDQALKPIMLQGLRLETRDSESVVWLITEDISAQKKADRLKNEFISTVSHELRTPLTSISGSLGLLANNAVGQLPEKASKLANIAYRNSRQLALLINDLLDVEKLAAGKMPFVLDEYPLPQMIRECAENMEPYARDRDVRINIGHLEDAQVQVDQHRFHQAVTNLLSNAIKFSPRDTRVDIFTESREGCVRLCIRDHGEGIAPEFRERIFQKFSQADASDRRANGGTGLGLAITRELMVNMKGTVDYASTPGEGAVFWLELPVAHSAVEQAFD
ncbi:sensor histidine kinase [Marinobacter apostichopi]|uniref:sensor histidine kinase n=1 Tax=Marinobacter apostichopi TaxID=3035454 RepID=UPI0025737ABB|nr:ATP-binding protein [Marinobacter sp. LA51]